MALIYAIFAIISSFVVGFIGLQLIWVALFGGSLSYETEGLIPKIKRWRKLKGG